MTVPGSLLQTTIRKTRGYTISQSIRFNDDDSAYMTKTFGGAGDGTGDTCTYSVWLKRGNLGTSQYFLSVDAVDPYFLGFQANDTLRFTRASGGSPSITTTAVFRDVGWYHIVLTIDTSLTSADRWKLYVNGVRQTVTTGGTPGSTNLGDAVAHYIGRYTAAASYFDGYMAEINFIDGTALDASSFGKVNSDTGQWVPIAYSGSYGTNGFYITGEDSADLGADYSGNGNDFTSSGLTSADQMLDTPTDGFCTLNPLYKDSAVVLSDGNLTATSASSNRVSMSTFAVNSGKWYWEMTFTGTMTGAVYGIGKHPVTLNNYLGIDQYGWSVLGGYSGAKLTNNSGGGFGVTYKGSNVLSGETVACALDMDTGKVYWGSDGTTDGTGTFAWYASGDPVAGTNFAFSGLTGDIYPACDADSRGTMVVNFGQSAFTYTPPTGFNALSSANLPDPTISDPSAHFQTTLYTGNGTAIGSGGLEVNQSGNSTFQPDFAWIKNRTTSGNEHDLYDAVRGATKVIFSSTTGAEATVTEGLVSFDSDGFTVGNRGEVNTSGNSMVAWQWKANGAGSSNTDGSITSTVSVNTTSGFSICTYTGNETSGATFGHGLGVAPKMVIVKERSPGGNNWMVGHDSVGWTKYLALDAAQAAITSSARWNNTAPSSTVVTLGNDTGINASGATYVAYCFAEVEGFSKISSFEGNSNADGTFVYTGFKPAFILTKNINTADQWGIRDAVRNPYNVTDKLLNPNASTAETTSSTGYIDILSNGFKPRSSDSNINTQTIIYMAFAESPFKTANAR